MNVKEPFLSTCEKDFINHAIEGGIRHDGRKQYEFRNLNINFGSSFGSVHVCLGETRILAQTTCEVQPPNTSRPHEGLLAVYLEIGPMAAPHFEISRQSDLGTLVNRALEKCLKDSKVINLESLCIRVGSKVWYIRLDLNVLNLDGNLVDAASIAAITSLAHFRRPDASVQGDDVIIHDFADKSPIPLIIQHYPVYVTYAFFNKGERIVADPTELEERIADGKISLAVNAYRELCGLHLEGNTSIEYKLVLKCAENAGKRSKHVVELIKSRLKEDDMSRINDEFVGFNACLTLNRIPSYSENSIFFKLFQYKQHMAEAIETKKTQEELKKIVEKPVIKQISPHSAELIRDNEVVVLDSESSNSDSDCEIVEDQAKNEPINVDDIQRKSDDTDSEEEMTVELKEDY